MILGSKLHYSITAVLAKRFCLENVKYNSWNNEIDNVKYIKSHGVFKNTGANFGTQDC